MIDLERKYAMLAEEADDAGLPGPEEVRERANRRARVQMAVGTVAAAALVGAIVVGGQMMLRADPKPTGPVANPGPVVTTAPATEPVPAAPTAADPSGTATASQPATGGNTAAATIPDSVFLQVADTNRTEPPSNGDAAEMLPTLCGAKYPSDGLIQARRIRHVVYAAKKAADHVPDGAIEQTVTRYQSTGATDFLREIQSSVNGCATETVDGKTRKYKLVTGTRHGDESVLFEVRSPTLDVNGDPTTFEDVRLVSVVRVGAAVMIMNIRGWESGTVIEPATVDKYAKLCVPRLRSWLD